MKTILLICLKTGVVEYQQTVEMSADRLQDFVSTGRIARRRRRTKDSEAATYRVEKPDGSVVFLEGISTVAKLLDYSPATLRGDVGSRPIFAKKGYFRHVTRRGHKICLLEDWELAQKDQAYQARARYTPRSQRQSDGADGAVT